MCGGNCGGFRNLKFEIFGARGFLSTIMLGIFLFIEEGTCIFPASLINLFFLEKLGTTLPSFQSMMRTAGFFRARYQSEARPSRMRQEVAR